MRVVTDRSAGGRLSLVRWLLAVTGGMAIAVVGLLVTAPKPAERRAAAAKRRAEALRDERLPAPFSALVGAARPKTPPQPGDWLDEHQETGQSLAEFQRDAVSAKGRVVYLVTIGPVDEAHAAMVDRLEPLLAAWFQLEVRRLPPIDEADAREGEREGQIGRQWYTRTLLDLLRQRRPEDAAAVMALTQVDLYPDPAWNFVFGEASYDERVGVSSFARGGDPRTEPALALRRALGTAVHEVGHMLRLEHCIAWECVMNGSNHREEADRRPLEPCPACQAKLQHAIRFDARGRWEVLVPAYADAGLEDAAAQAREALARTTPDARP